MTARAELRDGKRILGGETELLSSTGETKEIDRLLVYLFIRLIHQKVLVTAKTVVHTHPPANQHSRTPHLLGRFTLVEEQTLFIAVKSLRSVSIASLKQPDKRQREAERSEERHRYRSG